jgi:universal stress protein E
MARYESLLYFVDRENSVSGPMLLALARARGLGARLTFASVIPRVDASPLGDRLTPKRLEQLSIEAETERLEQLVDPLRDPGVQISTRVLVGDPAAAIVRAVVVDGYQMVWKAPTESRRVRDWILGSVDMRLIRACPCPVAVVGAHRLEEGRRVTVAAVDLASAPEDEEANEELNAKILNLGLASLVEQHTRLLVVHAWTLHGESIMRSPRARVKPEELSALLDRERASRRQRLEELVENHRSRLSGSDAERFAPEIHLVKGDPGSVIPSEAKRLNADLLVMGTIAKPRSTGFMIGNTAEKILHEIECSVVVAKPEGFVTPVGGV